VRVYPRRHSLMIYTVYYVIQCVNTLYLGCDKMGWEDKEMSEVSKHLYESIARYYPNIDMTDAEAVANVLEEIQKLPPPFGGEEPDFGIDWTREYLIKMAENIILSAQ
jgi:hypothetical protein